MAHVAQILAEHYQKTNELTFEMWTQRNRTFLILLGVIGAATLLNFGTPAANSFLVDLVARMLEISGSARMEDLRKSFPFGILQSILLFVVFYLMVNLYHRALYVLRSYHYLGGLEKEIRRHLQLAEEDIAFTREGTYYWGQRPKASSLVKYVYIGLLGLLLLAFLAGRIWDDFRFGNIFWAMVDVAIAIPTFFFFVEYTRASISLDTAGVVLKGLAGEGTAAAKSSVRQ